MVTRQRLSKRDHYRLQVNADQHDIAFLYNALVDYGRRETAADIRNKLAIAAVQTIRAHFSLLIKADPAFAQHVKRYRDHNIEPSLQPEATRLYTELGWNEHGSYGLL